MSMLAADYAAKATSVEGETALNTMSTEADSNDWITSQTELSQIQAMGVAKPSPSVKAMTKKIVPKATAKIISKPAKVIAKKPISKVVKKVPKK